eukprot:701619-Hanusia_phi.AAC.1
MRKVCPGPPGLRASGPPRAAGPLSARGNDVRRGGGGGAEEEGSEGAREGCTRSVKVRLRVRFTSCWRAFPIPPAPF